MGAEPTLRASNQNQSMKEKINSYRPTYEVEQPEKMTWKEVAEGVAAMLALLAIVLLILWFA